MRSGEKVFMFANSLFAPVLDRYWTSTMEEAVPKSKLEHLDLSWNNLGRKLADERSSATRSLVRS